MGIKQGTNKRENLFNLWMGLQLTCQKLLFTAWVNILSPFAIYSGLKRL